MWRVFIADSAGKALGTYTQKDQDRLRAALRGMEKSPLYGDCKQVAPQEYWRRVGAYGITFIVAPRPRFVEVRSIYPARLQ